MREKKKPSALAVDFLSDDDFDGGALITAQMLVLLAFRGGHRGGHKFKAPWRQPFAGVLGAVENAGRSVCPRTGWLARRAKPVERAWVRVAREAVGSEGQVVSGRTPMPRELMPPIGGTASALRCVAMPRSSRS